MAYATEFRIVREDSVTPRVLQDMRRGGHFVSRSSHIGNQYLSNMLLVSLGLPACLYDRTTFGKDLNYHPRARIIGGVREILTSADGSVVVPYGSFDQRVSDFGRPAQFHVKTFSSLFPKCVETESSLLLRHKERLEKVFSHLARYPELFDRYISPEGEFVCALPRRSVSGEELLSTIQTLRDLVYEEGIPLATIKGGFIPCISLVAVIIALVGYWESGQMVIYELSGPDMARYALRPSFREKTQQVWDILHWGEISRKSEIPPALTLRIIPTADFRFGYLTGDVGSLAVLEAIEEILDCQKAKRAGIGGVDKRNGSERLAVAELFNAAMAPLIRRVKESSWNIFYDIHAGSFFSHHDLLASGKTLAVPEKYLDMTFAEMERRMGLLKNILQI